MTRVRVMLALVGALLLAAVPSTVHAQPPSNDDFANAAVIDFSGQSSYGFASGATTEPDEPTCADDNSLWYTFTLTESMEIGIYFMGFSYSPDVSPMPSIEMQIGLYQSQPDLSLLHCATGGADFDVSFSATLSAGTYYIQAGAVGDPYHYSYTVAPPPPNDDMAAAETVVSTGHYCCQQTAVATTETGENACAARHSVWYTFTLKKPTSVNVYVEGLALNNYSLIEMNTGLYKASGAGLSLVKCKGGGDKRFVAFTKQLSAGTYYLQVGVADIVPYWYYLYFSVAPKNDHAAAAKQVHVPFNVVASALLAQPEATGEPNPIAGCPAGRYHTVWYTFTLNNQRIVKLDARESWLIRPNSLEEPPQHIPVIELWKDDNGGLLPVACDQTKSKLKRTLAAGTYYVRLSSPGGLNKLLPSHYYLTGTAKPLNSRDIMRVEIPLPQPEAPSGFRR